MLKRLFWITLALATIFLAGCGYRPLQSSVVSPSGTMKTIYIPVFVNKSYRPALEAVLANSITEEFARRRGEWRIAGEEGEYVLDGTVVIYDRQPVAYTPSDTVAEYRAFITTETLLRKRGSKKVIWKRTLSLYQNFPANSDIAIQQNSEDAAIQEVCQKVAQSIYVSLSDDF